jgi:hypothetical protein
MDRSRGLVRIGACADVSAIVAQIAWGDAKNRIGHFFTASCLRSVSLPYEKIGCATIDPFSHAPLK